MWDALNGAEPKVLNGHSHLVCSVTCSTDGTRIVSGSWDMSVLVWDASTWAVLKVLRGHTGWVNSVAISADGDKRATTLDGFSQIFHNFIRFNIHILSDRNRTTPTHSHIITRFGQAYRLIPNDFRSIALGHLDQIRHAAPPRTGTGKTIDAIVQNQ